MAKAVVTTDAHREAYLEQLTEEGRWDDYVEALRQSPNGLYRELADERSTKLIVKVWVYRGKTHALRWLCNGHKDGPFALTNPELCRAAAFLGHLGCLQYLREQGCPWGPNMCRDAAKHRHVILWLNALPPHSNGRPGCPCAAGPHEVPE
jgi:hypothetical protein